MAKKSRGLTIVSKIPDTPVAPATYGKFEATAYKEGWIAANKGFSRHARPNYLTHEEREAFDLGWEERKNLITLDELDELL
jgi:hypothetical protein